MENRVKQYFIPILVVLALVLGLSGCWANEATKTDVGALTQDEVCALVYDYLENKAASIFSIPYRMDLLNVLDIARPNFQAIYQSNGKWQVRALGCSINAYYRPTEWNYDGLWYFYEDSRVVEPVSNQASDLLRYIQFWTR